MLHTIDLPVRGPMNGQVLINGGAGNLVIGPTECPASRLTRTLRVG